MSELPQLKPLHVLFKDGMSYIRKEYPLEVADLRVNYLPVTVCRGDAGWVQTPGIIEKLERRIKHYGELTGYVLRDEYAHLAQVDGFGPGMPKEQPPGAFAWDPDMEQRKNDTMFGFYDAVTSPATEEWLEQRFEVIDLDSEPTPIPEWCKVDLVGQISQYREVWHKQPCSISHAKLWPLVVAAIHKHLDATPGYRITALYSNLQTITISQVLTLPPSLYVVKRVNTSRGRYRNEVQKERLVPVLKLVGDYASDRQGSDPYLVALKEVRAPNLAALEQAIKDEIRRIIEHYLPTGGIEVCGNCAGHGVLLSAQAATR